MCQMQRNRPTLGPVSSLDELHSIIGQLRKKHPAELFLFRGQTVLYPEVRSNLSRTGAAYHPDLERGLGTFACSILGAQPATIESFLLRNAVLQHYGLGTHYIDLTEAPAVAAWSASHRGVQKPLIFGGVWFRRLLIIWLFQQGPIDSVEACRDRLFRKRCASFSLTLPRRKPASSI